MNKYTKHNFDKFTKYYKRQKSFFIVILQRKFEQAPKDKMYAGQRFLQQEISTRKALGTKPFVHKHKQTLY